MPAKNSELERRVTQALMVAGRYGPSARESPHKQWVLDQMVRALTATPQAYKDWVRDYPNWDRGVSP